MIVLLSENMKDL